MSDSEQLYLSAVNLLKHQLKNQTFISRTKLTFNEIKNIIKWYDLKRNQRAARQTTQPDHHQEKLIQQVNLLQTQVNQLSTEIQSLKTQKQINGNANHINHKKSVSSGHDYLDKQLDNKKQIEQMEIGDKKLEEYIKGQIQQEFEKIHKLLSSQLKADINEIIYQSIQEQIFLSNNNSPKPDTLRKQSQSKVQSEDSQQNVNVIVECLEEEIGEYQNKMNFDHYTKKLNQLKIKQISDLYESMAQEYKDISKPYYIGPEEKVKQYKLNSQEADIHDYIGGYRFVRQDSNCFYATFGYQYMDIILSCADDQNFETFMDNIKGIPFDLHNGDYEISNEEQQELKQIFCHRCIELRQIENSQRSQELWNQMSDPNNGFYGLTVIFIRNLINQILQQSELNQQLSEEDQAQLYFSFLEWKIPCEEAELVLEVLAHELELCIVLYILDDEKEEFTIRIFGDEQNYQLHILQSETCPFLIGIRHS